MLRAVVLVVVLVLTVVLTGGCGGRTNSSVPYGPADAAANVLTLGPTGDTMLNAGSPATNYGAQPTMACGNYPKGIQRRDLIGFDLKKIPVTATVNKASLYLYVEAVNQGTDRYRIHRVTKPWQEMTATWGSHGAAYSATISSVRTIDPSMVGTVVRYDVTGLVKSWVETPSRNFGCLVRASEGTAHIGVVFGTRQNGLAGHRPRLVVDYTP